MVRIIQFRPAHIPRDNQQINMAYDSGSILYINYLYYP